MAKYFKNTFIDGLDRDTAVNKYDNTHFFNAENVRLISDDPLSSGAMTSIKGTSAKAVISGEGNKILGSCNIRDFVVLFVYTPSEGRIYKFVDNGSSLPEEGELTLIYGNSDLIFNPNLPIFAEGRYENDNIQKVYFSDGETFFKNINIANPQSNSSSMDVVADCLFSPINGSIIQGGSLKAGKVQYSYQMYGVNGSESVFSPTSPLYSIADSLDSVKSSIYVSGYDQGTISDKSIKVSITPIISSNFNRLRLVAIDYESINQTPSIRIVGEYDIVNLQTIEIVDTGNSIGSLTLEEFRFITNSFFPKTIASKDNILFAGNINEQFFDISDEEFDARAFRFKLTDGILENGNFDSYIINNPGSNNESSQKIFYDNILNKIYTEGDSDVNIDTSHDCYNQFNDLSNDGNSLFKYIYDPVNKKIGGIGKNISYEFVETQTVISEGSSGWTSIYPKVTSEVFDNTNLVQELADFVGYQRDEIYRFGIVLYDLKGRPSFTKWIGDIRFPNNNEMRYSGGSGQLVTANNLGIKFTVNFPQTVLDKISGYQIVRCERTDRDKTVKSSGVTSKLINDDQFSWDGEGKIHSAASLPTLGENYHANILDQRRDDQSVGKIVLDKPLNPCLDSRHWEYISPEISFGRKINIDSNDFVEIVGGINTLTKSAWAQTDDRQTLCDKVTNFMGAENSYSNRKTISSTRVFSQTSRSASSFTLEDSYRYFNATSNLYSINPRIGARGKFMLISYDTTFNITKAPLSTYWGKSDHDYCWAVQYIRSNNNLSIYGGITYNSRLSNTYYQASKIVSKDVSSVDVYGGDTYIDMLVYLRSIDDIISQSQTLMIFPIESTINLKFRSDKIQRYITWSLAWGDDIDGEEYRLQETVADGVLTYNIEYPVEVGDLYRYNDAYSAMDKSKVFIPRPYDLSNNKIFDTRVYASNVKISGEYIDSWLKFKYNEYKDLDSQFGSLTKLLNVNNKLMFFQPDGVGILSVNDRALAQSPTSYSLTLGTGSVLERFDYLTFDSGAVYPEDIVKSNKTFYYVDRVRKRISKYEGSDTPISLIKGINSLLKSADIDRVRCGFDPNYMDVFFCIDNLTLTFNELTNGFGPIQSFSPDKILTIGNSVYSIADTVNTTVLSTDGIINVDYDNFNNYILVRESTAGNTLFKHNVSLTGRFYDSATNNSIIDLIIHPEGNSVCQFTNIDLRMDITDTGVEQIEDVIAEYTNDAGVASPIVNVGYRFPPKTKVVIPTYSAIKKVKFSNSYMSQEFNVVYFRPDYKLDPLTEVFIKKIGKTWRIQVPIIKSRLPIIEGFDTTGLVGSPSRFVDTYIQVKLTFDNSTVKSWKLHDLTTYYDIVKV